MIWLIGLFLLLWLIVSICDRYQYHFKFDIKDGERVRMKEDYEGSDIFVRTGTCGVLSSTLRNYAIVSFDGFPFEVMISKFSLEREVK